MSSAFLKKLAVRFEGLEDQLNKLDAATGDGDHGATIVKGLKAAADAEEMPAKAFRKAAGGASGSLFGILIGAADDVSGGTKPAGEALSAAADRISQMGQAKLGDKTMLDALIPAAEAAGADNNITAAAGAARQGAAATKELAAKRGRAKYVENAGVGHVDAGATSVAEILTALEEHLGKADA